jgi:Ni/Co efflux regulator RcnB
MELNKKICVLSILALIILIAIAPEVSGSYKVSVPKMPILYMLQMPSTVNESYDWAVGGYTKVIGLSDYSAYWYLGFKYVFSGNYSIAYMLNVPVNVSGYLNVSLYSPFSSFIPPPVEVNISWMWIQDAVSMLPNGSVIPVINIWFVPNPPAFYAIIYVIYGGLQLSYDQPYNETVYYSNNAWHIVLNNVEIAEVSNQGVKVEIKAQEVIATEILGIVWPWTNVSGFALSLSSYSTSINNVLPSAGIEVHSENINQFVIDNQYFVTTFNVFANGKRVTLYYANSTSIYTDYGFMAGLNPPPNGIYGGNIGNYYVIGTLAGIKALAHYMGLPYYVTDIANSTM